MSYSTCRGRLNGIVEKRRCVDLAEDCVCERGVYECVRTSVYQLGLDTLCRDFWSRIDEGRGQECEAFMNTAGVVRRDYFETSRA